MGVMRKKITAVIRSNGERQALCYFLVAAHFMGKGK